MDVGRADGAGPSKQDALLDGAGCQVIGPNTVDRLDAATRTVYCQVRVNVGPVANLFKAANNEVPILIKVLMKNGLSTNYSFERKYDDVLNTFGAVEVGASNNAVRGLIGVSVVRP